MVGSIVQWCLTPPTSNSGHQLTLLPQIAPVPRQTLVCTGAGSEPRHFLHTYVSLVAVVAPSEFKVTSWSLVRGSISPMETSGRMGGWLRTCLDWRIFIGILEFAIPVERECVDAFGTREIIFWPCLDCKFLQSGHCSTFCLYLTNFVRS